MFRAKAGPARKRSLRTGRAATASAARTTRLRHLLLPAGRRLVPEPLPVADCGATDMCRWGLATESTRCYETCTWGETACTSGACIFDTGLYSAEVCASGEDEVASRHARRAMRRTPLHAPVQCHRRPRTGLLRLRQAVPSRSAKRTPTAPASPARPARPSLPIGRSATARSPGRRNRPGAGPFGLPRRWALPRVLGMAKKLNVDVWSDIACPWCYIGKRRLEARCGVSACGRRGDDLACVRARPVCAGGA